MTEDEAIMERRNRGKPDFSGLEPLKREPGPPPMQRVTFEELSVKDIPEPKYLIDGIIREAGAALVFGPPGIGKSWVTSTCAFMAAHGRGLTLVDGLKAGDHEGVRVLIYDGEMVEFDIKKRNARLCDILHLGDRAAETRRNIYCYLKAAQPPGTNFIDLATMSHHAKILNECRELDIGLIIFDNLATLSSSLRDENDATCWNPLNDLIVSLKSIGVATLLVHHSNRGSKGDYRGSSNIMATLETVLQLQETDWGTKADEGARLGISFQKTRNSSVVSLNGKILHLPLVGPWEIETGGDIQMILDALKTGQYKGQAQIAKALDINQGTVSRKLKKAVEKGLITKQEIEDYYKGIVRIEYPPADAFDPFEGSECINFEALRDKALKRDRGDIIL